MHHRNLVWAATLDAFLDGLHVITKSAYMAALTRKQLSYKWDQMSSELMILAEEPEKCQNHTK
jgi:hypothetical protein